MAKHFAEGHGAHVYCDLPIELRDRFRAACKANGLKMGEVLRYTIQVFVETAEAAPIAEAQEAPSN